MAKYENIKPANIDRDLKFTIRSKNWVGISDEFSSVIVPKLRDRQNNLVNIKKFVRIETENYREYNLSWSPIDKDAVDTYTVFWCKAIHYNSPNDCDVCSILHFVYKYLINF